MENSILKINTTLKLSQDVKISDREYFSTIYLSKNDYNKYKNFNFVLYIVNKGKYENVIIKSNDKVDEGQYVINAYIINRYNLTNIDDIKLYIINEDNVLTFSDIKLQALKYIQKEYILVGEKAYNIVQSYNTKYVIVYSKKDNSHFIANVSHIIKSDILTVGAIRLNRKQRLALNIDDDDKEKNVIIVPMLQCKYENKVKLTEKILDFYIGKINYSLIAKRTMAVDENFNVVRLSKSNMKLLGVENFDMVKMTYKDNIVKSRVLEIENSNIIVENNEYDLNNKKLKPIDIDMIVAIPAFVRDELEVPTVIGNVSVKIERDMGYIWKKNISNQVLPIILILFTSEIFVSLSSILLSILFALLSLPVVLYFNLSKERSIAKC